MTSFFSPLSLPLSQYVPAAYTSYLTNTTLNGRIAQTLNGSTIVLEHRFFGESNPYDALSVANFRVHTVQQAVADLVYFAQNVDLPMPGGDAVAPGEAPWILIGGSYAGALTGYTLQRCVSPNPFLPSFPDFCGSAFLGTSADFCAMPSSTPGVFYAGYASSAVVQATV